MNAPTSIRSAPRFLICAMLAAVLLLAACGGDGDGDEEQDAPPFEPQPTSDEPVTFTGGPFITSNRDHMAFCASDVSGLALSEEDADRIAAAIEAVIERVGEDNWPADRTLYSLTEGCPEPAAPLGTRLEQPREVDAYAVETEHPSVYRVFVYLTPSEMYEATFGDLAYVEAAAEMSCVDGSCAEVATALYVPHGVSDDDLTAALHAATGIETP